MEKVVAIFHGDCPDGFGGAWAARQTLGGRATYLAARHQEPLPKGLRGRTVYLIDFSYPLPLMRRLVRTARRVVAIDHHKGARPSARIAAERRFALNHSGAVLAWQYFHPGARVPLLLRYIEDVDIWRHRLPKNREVSAALEGMPFEFLAWDRLVRNFERQRWREKFIAEGKIILDSQERLRAKMLECAASVRFRGKTYLAVNSPIFASELGHALTTAQSPIGIVWYTGHGGTKVSFRSIGKVDVAKIARRWGGGGHPHAASFRLPVGAPLPWKFLRPRGRPRKTGL